eukprot:scaffold7791_cov37-Phaeocystis_antarctica.AAC.3
MNESRPFPSAWRYRARGRNHSPERNAHGHGRWRSVTGSTRCARGSAKDVTNNRSLAQRTRPPKFRRSICLALVSLGHYPPVVC